MVQQINRLISGWTGTKTRATINTEDVLFSDIRDTITTLFDLSKDLRFFVLLPEAGDFFYT